MDIFRDRADYKPRLRERCLRWTAYSVFLLGVSTLTVCGVRAASEPSRVDPRNTFGVNSETSIFLNHPPFNLPEQWRAWTVPIKGLGF